MDLAGKALDRFVILYLANVIAVSWPKLLALRFILGCDKTRTGSTGSQ